MASEKSHTGIQPIRVKFSPFGKKQRAKEPFTVCTIYYRHVQNMTANVTQSSCYKIRSACCFPSMMLFSRMAHMLKFETPWVKLLGWRIPLQAVPDVAYVAPRAQKDELILEGNYFELTSNSGFDPTGHGNKKLKKNKTKQNSHTHTHQNGHQKSCGW